MWTFYSSEFPSKVRNTASNLQGRHDPGGHIAHVVYACYPGYAAEDSAFET